MFHLFLSHIQCITGSVSSPISFWNFFGKSVLSVFGKVISPLSTLETCFISKINDNYNPNVVLIYNFNFTIHTTNFVTTKIICWFSGWKLISLRYKSQDLGFCELKMSRFYDTVSFNSKKVKKNDQLRIWLSKCTVLYSRNWMYCLVFQKLSTLSCCINKR